MMPFQSDELDNGKAHSHETVNDAETPSHDRAPFSDPLAGGDPTAPGAPHEPGGIAMRQSEYERRPAHEPSPDSDDDTTHKRD